MNKVYKLFNKLLINVNCIPFDKGADQMKSDYDFFHDIVEAMERKMDAKLKKHNTEKEMSQNPSLDKLPEQHKLQEKDDLTILAYLNSLKKDPPIRPRTVHFSKEIKESEKHFSDDLREKYNHIINQIKNGDQLTYHLSRTIFDGCFQDTLLNTWGITHIHLSSIDVSSKSGMKRNRSGYLLLCIIKENDVFLIDVIKHPDKPEDFACLDYLEIIYNNTWMNQIGYDKIDAVEVTFTLNDIFNDKESKAFDFMKCCNTAVGFNGEFFLPIDRGVVSTGHSMMDVLLKNSFCRSICNIRKNSSTCEYIASDESENNLGTINGCRNDGTTYHYTISDYLSIIDTSPS